MKTIFPIDEINAFKDNLHTHFNEEGHIASRKDCEDIIDEMFDLYLLALANGVEAVNEQFELSIELSTETVDAIINKEIEGATWIDRVWTWYETDGTEADIVRIAETEAHRDGNTGAYEAATLAGATQKTWVCMMLPTSRDTHIYLDGTTVAMEDEFYSYSGYHAMFPGEFGVAEEDVNCLCEVAYS